MSTGTEIIGFDSERGFALLQRQAQLFSQSSLVPTDYRKNVANCAIALEMACRLRASPLMVMQNLHIIHGNPSWSSKFLIATINTCGRYSSLDYESAGGDEPRSPTYKMRAYAIEKATNRKLIGEWIDWILVKEEGWDSKKGSKWVTMPGQMFRYRAAAFWQRAYCPEISLGFVSLEEAHEIKEREVYGIATPSSNDGMAKLRAINANEDQKVNNVLKQDSKTEVDIDIDQEIEKLKQFTRLDQEKKRNDWVGESVGQQDQVKINNFGAN